MKALHARFAGLIGRAVGPATVFLALAIVSLVLHIAMQIAAGLARCATLGTWP